MAIVDILQTRKLGPDTSPQVTRLINGAWGVGIQAARLLRVLGGRRKRRWKTVLILGDRRHVQQVSGECHFLNEREQERGYLFFLLKALKMERETERERPLLTALKEEEK